MQEDSSIGEGIYQIPKVGVSNAYLVEINPNSLILIDTGTSSGGSKVLDYLQKTGRGPNMISEIILTHADPDHSGSAANLKRVTGAKLAAHETDAARVSGQVKNIKETNGIGNLLFNFFGIFMKVDRVKPDILLDDGDQVGPLSIIYTPGHTDGSICVYKPGQTLFAGDTLITSRSGKIQLPSRFLNKNTDQLKKSVEKLTSLEFTSLLPGHGPPITSNASQRLKDFVAGGFK